MQDEKEAEDRGFAVNPGNSGPDATVNRVEGHYCRFDEETLARPWLKGGRGKLCMPLDG